MGFRSRTPSTVKLMAPRPSHRMPTSANPGDIAITKPAVKISARSPRVLAADDQQHMLEAIELLLRPQGYKVDVVRSPALAREALASASYDAVLIDLNYARDT